VEQEAANELQDIEVHDTCLLASVESRYGTRQRV